MLIKSFITIFIFYLFIFANISYAGFEEILAKANFLKDLSLNPFIYYRFVDYKVGTSTTGVKEKGQPGLGVSYQKIVAENHTVLATMFSTFPLNTKIGFDSNYGLSVGFSRDYEMFSFYPLLSFLHYSYADYESTHYKASSGNDFLIGGGGQIKIQNHKINLNAQMSFDQSTLVSFQYLYAFTKMVELKVGVDYLDFKKKAEGWMFSVGPNIKF